MARQFFTLCFIVTCIGGLLLLVMDWSKKKTPSVINFLMVKQYNISQEKIEIVSSSFYNHSNDSISVDSDQYRQASRHELSAGTAVDSIYIVISIDTKELEGLLALLQSLKKHTTEAVVTYIISSSEDIEEISTAVKCAFLISDKFQVFVKNFSIPVNIVDLIVTQEKKKYLAEPANFARFYFYKLFPDLSHIIYLDVDIIVKHDIKELWKIVKQTNKLLVAVPRKGHIGSYFTSNVSDLFQSRYGKKMSSTSPDFNAGVVGMNLQKWRANNVSDELVYWMQLNKQHRLWNLGTQPIMYLLVNNDFEGVDGRWNVDGLGWKIVSTRKLSTAFILHWTGKCRYMVEDNRCGLNQVFINSLQINPGMTIGDYIRIVVGGRNTE